MLPVPFTGSNKTLSKPKDMTDEECAPLEIYTDGKQCVSVWKLSKEDLEKVNKTGVIYLSIISGSTQPPVSVEVDNPFIDESCGIPII